MLLVDDSADEWEFTFAAAGDAVDNGTVCESGVVTTQAATGEDVVALWFDDLGDPNRLTEDTFTCADGSGSFVLRAEFSFENEQGQRGAWSISNGTGDLSSLAGNGTYLPPDQIPLDQIDSGVFAIYSGEVSR